MTDEEHAKAVADAQVIGGLKALMSVGLQELERLDAEHKQRVGGLRNLFSNLQFEMDKLGEKP